MQLNILKIYYLIKGKKDDSNIINMNLEFLPALFLSAILRKKSLILKNLKFTKCCSIRKI